MEASVRRKEGQEYCIPGCVISTDKEKECVLPLINISNQDLVIKKSTLFARVTPCKYENEEKICHIANIDDIQMGDLTTE